MNIHKNPPRYKDKLNYSRVALSRAYYIPLRTLENWDRKQNMPDYVEVLIKYTFFIKEITKMKPLQNRIDFCVIISVDGANPNGDPLVPGYPRILYDGHGEISDVCIKRK